MAGEKLTDDHHNAHLPTSRETPDKPAGQQSLKTHGASSSKYSNNYADASSRFSYQGPRNRRATKSETSTSATHALYNPTLSFQGPPPIVHGNGEDYDANFVARGHRVCHKEESILINFHTQPSAVFDQHFILQHGEAFCKRVLLHIAKLNHEETTEFATDWARRYHNAGRFREYLDLVHEENVEKVFSQDVLHKYGPGFLKTVQLACQSGLIVFERTTNLSPPPLENTVETDVPSHHETQVARQPSNGQGTSARSLNNESGPSSAPLMNSHQNLLTDPRRVVSDGNKSDQSSSAGPLSVVSAQHAVNQVPYLAAGHIDMLPAGSLPEPRSFSASDSGSISGSIFPSVHGRSTRQSREPSYHGASPAGESVRYHRPGVPDSHNLRRTYSYHHLSHQGQMPSTRHAPDSQALSSIPSPQPTAVQQASGIYSSQPTVSHYSPTSVTSPITNQPYNLASHNQTGSPHTFNPQLASNSGPSFHNLPPAFVPQAQGYPPHGPYLSDRAGHLPRMPPSVPHHYHYPLASSNQYGSNRGYVPHSHGRGPSQTFDANTYDRDYRNTQLQGENKTPSYRRLSKGHKNKNGRRGSNTSDNYPRSQPTYPRLYDPKQDVGNNHSRRYSSVREKRPFLESNSGASQSEPQTLHRVASETGQTMEPFPEFDEQHPAGISESAAPVAITTPTDAASKIPSSPPRPSSAPPNAPEAIETSDIIPSSSKSSEPMLKSAHHERALSTGLEDGCTSQYIGKNVTDVNNLWVGHLSTLIDPKKLAKAFSDIVGVQVRHIDCIKSSPQIGHMGDHGVGWCFVNFHTTDDARVGLKLDGVKLEDSVLKVSVPHRYFQERKRHVSFSGRRTSLGQNDSRNPEVKPGTNVQDSSSLVTKPLVGANLEPIQETSEQVERKQLKERRKSNSPNKVDNRQKENQQQQKAMEPTSLETFRKPELQHKKHRKQNKSGSSVTTNATEIEQPSLALSTSAANITPVRGESKAQLSNNSPVRGSPLVEPSQSLPRIASYAQKLAQTPSTTKEDVRTIINTSPEASLAREISAPTTAPLSENRSQVDPFLETHAGVQEQKEKPGAGFGSELSSVLESMGKPVVMGSVDSQVDHLPPDPNKHVDSKPTVSEALDKSKSASAKSSAHDTWKHPFLREKEEMKKQKQAAKNQKKKEKKKGPLSKPQTGLTEADREIKPSPSPSLAGEERTEDALDSVDISVEQATDRRGPKKAIPEWNGGVENQQRSEVAPNTITIMQIIGNETDSAESLDKIKGLNESDNRVESTSELRPDMASLEPVEAQLSTYPQPPLLPDTENDPQISPILPHSGTQTIMESLTTKRKKRKAKKKSLPTLTQAIPEGEGDGQERTEPPVQSEHGNGHQTPPHSTASTPNRPTTGHVFTQEVHPKLPGRGPYNQYPALAHVHERGFTSTGFPIAALLTAGNPQNTIEPPQYRSMVPPNAIDPKSPYRRGEIPLSGSPHVERSLEYNGNMQYVAAHCRNFSINSNASDDVYARQPGPPPNTGQPSPLRAADRPNSYGMKPVGELIEEPKSKREASGFRGIRGGGNASDEFGSSDGHEESSDVSTVVAGLLSGQVEAGPSKNAVLQEGLAGEDGSTEKRKNKRNKKKNKKSGSETTDSTHSAAGASG